MNKKKGLLTTVGATYIGFGGDGPQSPKIDHEFSGTKSKKSGIWIMALMVTGICGEMGAMVPDRVVKEDDGVRSTDAAREAISKPSTREHRIDSWYRMPGIRLRVAGADIDQQKYGVPPCAVRVRPVDAAVQVAQVESESVARIALGDNPDGGVGKSLVKQDRGERDDKKYAGLKVVKTYSVQYDSYCD